MSRAEKRQEEIIKEFSAIKGWEDRYKEIIKIGKSLPKQDKSLYDDKWLVKGCQSQVWLSAHLNSQGEVELKADSDALIVKGLVALLVRAYSGLKPKEILQARPEFIDKLGFNDYLSPSRANGFLAMVKQIMLYAQVFSFSK